MELAHFRRIAEPHPKAVRWNVEPPMPLGNITVGHRRWCIAQPTPSRRSTTERRTRTSSWPCRRSPGVSPSWPAPPVPPPRPVLYGLPRPAVAVSNEIMSMKRAGHGRHE